MPKVIYTDTKGLYQTSGTGIELAGSTNLTGQTTIDAPAAAAAAAASTIKVSTNLQLVTQATNANDRIYLPSPTVCPTGHVVILIDTDGGGYELSSKGDGTTATTINGTAVTNSAGVFSKELAIAADVMAVCVKSGANAWSVGSLTATVPD